MADSCVKDKLKELDGKRGPEPVPKRTGVSFLFSIEQTAEKSKRHKPYDISYYIIIRCKDRTLHK